MELNVIDLTGKDTGRTAKLNKNVFGIEPNDHAIYLDVKQHLANKRQGTHKSKQRNEVSGSSKKLKRQKGTGGARAGNIKNPQFVGGGRIFGPVPRDYGFKLNKKLKKLARLSALSYKAKDKLITVLEDFRFDEPKTKNYLEVLKTLEMNGRKTLMITPDVNTNVMLSARNLPKSKVSRASDINTYDILHANNLLIMEGSLPVIEKTLLESDNK